MRLLLHPALPHTHPPLPVELAVSTRFTTADLARPVSPIHLLGGGGLTAALSAAGTGVVTSGGADLTRWRADRVEDADGLALFLRDLDTGHVWTAGWRPGDEAYEARFGVGTVEIVRQDAGVETRLCLAVAPAGALVGRLQLRSLDGRARRIEVTTLAEVVLHDRAADASHPAFSKLFVQTERLDGRPGLLAKRRPRTPEDPSMWLSHWLDDAAEAVSWETDRLRCVGRGRRRTDPAMIDAPGGLGGTVGAVLDPVVALRTVVEVPAEGVATRAFGLAGGDAREAVTAHADALGDLGAVEQALQAASDAEQARRDRLGLDGSAAEAAQALVGPLLLGDPGLWAPAGLRAAPTDTGTLPLDGAGPLVVVRVRTEAGVAAVRHLAAWQGYWADLGLPVQLLAVADPGLLGAVTEAGDPARGAGVPVVDPDREALAAQRADVWADDTLPAPSADPLPLAEAPTPSVPSGDLALDDADLREFNGTGGFSADGTEYVMHLRPRADGRLSLPPLPWANVIANEHGGFLVTERGAASTWSANSRENRVTPWANDPVEDPGEALHLQDLDAGTLWSPTGGPTPADAPVEVRHGFGYSTWRTVADGIAQHTTMSVAPDASAKLTVVRLTNTGGASRRLAVTASTQLTLGPRETPRDVVTARSGDVLTARNATRGEFSDRVAMARAVAPEGADVSLTADRAAFLGRFGATEAPCVLVAGGPLDGVVGPGLDAAVHRVALTLAPGETASVAFVLGEAENAAEAEALAARFAHLDAVTDAIDRTRAFWTETTSALQVETPDPALDLMVNGWLLYQNLSCRLWGRTAFYQSGGAYGFRDQLQDTSALVYARPDLTRAQILRNAAHQFEEGDVLHWWHPPLSKGIRTRFADDLLWLPLLASAYAETTGDDSVFDEEVCFLTAPLLEDGQDEVFLQPTEAGSSASVYEHAARTIDRSLAVGVHGLPLMGTGDWNDGMNRVGREGRGESVWMGFFLASALDAFLPHVEARGDADRAARYRQHRAHLQAALNADGWDGDWYRRAFYDNGAVMGSAQSDECQIDALAQAWAVLSGVAPADRAAQALDAMEARLVDEGAGILRLLAPPFDVTPNDPGYIKGYVPGVRENGGQYTHAALWAVRALAEAGRCERAAPLLGMLSPVRHGDSPEAVAVYKTEPYVIAADVYGVAPHVGRGGWTWYTGSAGWMLRVAVESVLGFGLDRGEAITLVPCIPADWPGFSIRYRLPDGSGTVYAISVQRGDTPGLTVDGATPPASGDGWRVPLVRDGAVHEVRLTI